MNQAPSKLLILSLLRTSQGWLSGEAISEQLGISRAAVAKHISTLRAEGYLIDALTRRGYQLRMEPDVVDINRIRNALTTTVIGRGQWVWLESTDSTNSAAAALGAAKAPEGSLVLADVQTQGRGRRGRAWYSAPRSVQFSVLLRPNLPVRQLSVLSVLACLALQTTLGELSGAECTIKWPNDLLIKGKKVAAVLVEANILGGEMMWAVMGIGCNLNAVSAEFPQALQDIVTSVYEATGRQLARNTVYETLLAELDKYYAILQTDGPRPLIDEWKQQTAILGNTLTLVAHGQTVTGEAVDLSEDGLLVLRDKAGTEHHFEVGDEAVS